MAEALRAHQIHIRRENWHTRSTIAKRGHRMAMYGMKRVRSPAWANLFVLGMLCLRALVPAGTMLAPSQAHPALVMCSAALPTSVRTGNPYESSHGAGSAHDAGAPHGGAHSDPDCPYAQSAGPAPLPTLPLLTHAAPRDAEVASGRVAQIFPSSGPTRQQTPRGPPLHA